VLCPRSPSASASGDCRQKNQLGCISYWLK
jgi:hypothetical protein